MNLRTLFEANGINWNFTFTPGLDYFPELSLLLVLLEDVGYVSRFVNSSMSIYLHPEDKHHVGVELWIPYSPQRLLAHQQ